MNPIEQALLIWSKIQHDNGEFNILIGNISETDKNTLFGPLYPFDEFKEFPIDTKMPNLLKELGFFKSNGQARKAGWKDEIPVGWSSFTIGKKKRQIHILKEGK